MRTLSHHRFAKTHNRSLTKPLNARVYSVIVGCLLGAQFVAPLPARAYTFTRTLQKGDVGRDVVALEVRMAGWLPSQNQESLKIDRRFSLRTEEAVQRFQAFYGLTPDGIAGPDTYSVLAKKQDADGSTVHFAWGEFKQNRNSSCSAKANAYAGTFQGGMASSTRVKRYVRRLMWRLEALRATAGGHLIGINSGFRSVDYNTCIGGAGLSQHMYGTAADQRMAHVSNHRERRLGEKTDFSGIGCYSQLTHNHFDIRVDNRDLRSSQFWWWPKQNAKGQDLDDQNKPCYGEAASGASKGPELNQSSADILTRSQVMSFMAHGEPGDLGAGE